jgi:hypothetical protein
MSEDELTEYFKELESWQFYKLIQQEAARRVSSGECNYIELQREHVAILTLAFLEV